MGSGQETGVAGAASTITAAVLVIIVNYRTAALAIDAVAALGDEVLRRGDCRVVVVDNGSADGSAEAIGAAIEARGFGAWCALVALAENRGFAAGNNAGLRWHRERTGALPEFSWLLNPDTIAEPGAIGALVDFLRAEPGAGLAGSRCLYADGTPRHSAFRFHSPRRELIAAVDFGPVTRLLGGAPVAVELSDRPRRVDWVSGSSIMIRRAVIEAIGLMDEGYFLYFEEEDYCATAADAGFSCWNVPASRVVHIGGQATGVTGAARARNRRPRYWFYSRARFFLHRYGVARTHAANLLWLAGYLVGGAIAAARGRRRDDPPRLWRDFAAAYYGPGGLMFRPGAMAA